MTGHDGTRLETGYGPTRPRGDNLLNDFVQESAASYAAFGEHAAIGSSGSTGVGHADRRGLAAAVQQPGRARATDRRHSATVARSHPRRSTTRARRRRSCSTARGRPPISRRSASRSWVIRRSWCARRTRRSPPPPPELRIVRGRRRPHRVRLRAHADLRLPRAAAAADGRGHARSRPSALDAPGWHHFVGYVDDEPVASGSGYVGDRLVRVDNIATLETRAAAATGSRSPRPTSPSTSSKPATLIASDLGRPVYERLGFVAHVARHVLARAALPLSAGQTPKFAAVHDRDRRRVAVERRRSAASLRPDMYSVELARSRRSSSPARLRSTPLARDRRACAA